MSDYSYRKSVKSDFSDELINTYVLRPIAGLVVRLLYHAPITPNQVTVAAIIAGLIAAGCYWQGNAMTTAIGGILVTLKDLLDSVDGQLARARNQFSRRGRFLDSVGDLIVTVAVLGAISWSLYKDSGDSAFFFLAAAGALGVTLRVSYHVFYQVSYLHLHQTYSGNRIVEEITDEDRRADSVTQMLQRIFLILYGWQDRFMLKIDRWCLGEVDDESGRRRWYEDRVGLWISGFLGYGTELFVLTLCSLVNEIELYLWLNLFLMNGVMVAAIFYRRVVLRPRVAIKSS